MLKNPSFSNGVMSPSQPPKSGIISPHQQHAMNQPGMSSQQHQQGMPQQSLPPGHNGIGPWNMPPQHLHGGMLPAHLHQQQNGLPPGMMPNRMQMPPHPHSNMMMAGPNPHGGMISPGLGQPQQAPPSNMTLNHHNHHHHINNLIRGPSPHGGMISPGSGAPRPQQQQQAPPPNMILNHQHLNNPNMIRGPSPHGGMVSPGAGQHQQPAAPSSSNMMMSHGGGFPHGHPHAGHPNQTVPGGGMMGMMMGGPPPPASLANSRVYPPNQPMIFNPQNPNAPPIYPCGVCHREVQGQVDQAIMCESGCNFWFHRTCVHMSAEAYHFLKSEIYAEWVCENCIHNKRINPIKFKF
jgi:hypothetical protein